MRERSEFLWAALWGTAIGALGVALFSMMIALKAWGETHDIGRIQNARIKTLETTCQGKAER